MFILQNRSSVNVYRMNEWMTSIFTPLWYWVGMIKEAQGWVLTERTGALRNFWLWIKRRRNTKNRCPLLFFCPEVQFLHVCHLHVWTYQQNESRILICLSGLNGQENSSRDRNENAINLLCQLGGLKWHYLPQKSKKKKKCAHHCQFFLRHREL